MKGYTRFILTNAPRMLSNIDRRRQSPTYGCADRNYWHYKIVDFPCAMLQETCLTLAQLYTVDFEGNIYYGKEVIRELSLAVIYYCMRIQKKDGSFDEFFPNEHSFSPTAFNLYSICRAYRILELDEPSIIQSAAKSARFALRYGDCGASNQMIAAIAGIYRYYLLSEDDSVLPDLDLMLERVLSSQSDEGWTPEYEGPDIGYQSIALGYLSDYHRISHDPRVRDPIDKMIEFLSHFVHPDGSSGGEYGSRLTSFLAPHGFELNGGSNLLARRIADSVFLNGNVSANFALDDRYVCHFLLPSYLTAIQYYSPSDSNAVLPCEDERESFLPESGIFIKSTKAYYLVCNLKKGGCLKVYDRNGESFSDAGYTLNGAHGIAINNWLDEGNKASASPGRLESEGAFHKMVTRVPTTLWHFALRITTLVVGRSVLPFLKKHFILRKKPIDVTCRRTVDHDDTGINIRDEIGSETGRIFSLYESDSLAYRYVAPTNYFARTELSDLSPGSAAIGENVRQVKIEKSIRFHPMQVTRKVLSEPVPQPSKIGCALGADDL